MLEKIIEKQTAEQERTLERWMEKHSREVPFPEGVRVVENVDYLGDGAPCHRMDIYCPTDAAAQLPVVVNLHGGGFLLGKKEANRLFCADLCKRGFAIFCLEYPLAPETTIFEMFRDLTAGINRVSDLAGAYGGDGRWLILCGDSAGAYLCLYLAAMQRAPKVAAVAGVRPIRPEITALGLQSGMFYTEKPDKIGLFLPKLIYGKGWRRHPFHPYLNPENPELLQGLPPCFLVTGDGDFLRHYSRQLAAALERNGVEHRLLDLTAEKKLPHAFAAMLPEMPEARQANEEMAAFFMAHGRKNTEK